MDTKLVVSQLTEDWKIEADNLVPLYKEAAMRLRRTGAKLTWIPRPEIVKQLGH